jgi:hypothetical protein
LVALFGVLTVALPAIRTFVTPRNSDFALTYQGATSSYITILAANKGVRPGTVRRPIALVVGAPGKQDNSIALSIYDAKGSATLIDAGKSVLLELYANEFLGNAVTGAAELFSTLHELTCKVTISETSFVGESSSPEIAIECDKIKQFVFEVKDLMDHPRGKEHSFQIPSPPAQP